MLRRYALQLNNTTDLCACEYKFQKSTIGISDGQIQVMIWFDLIWFKSWWITHNDLIWRTRIWFGKSVIWFGFDLKFCDLIWNHSKSPIFLHNTMLLRVIDQRRRPCFVLTPLSFSNSTVILIYLELILW